MVSRRCASKGSFLNYIELNVGQWMCAGGESKDACQGFGGAPLVFRENGLFKQVQFNFYF